MLKFLATTKLLLVNLLLRFVKFVNLNHTMVKVLCMLASTLSVKLVRLLKLEDMDSPAPDDALDIKKVSGGLLIQDTDRGLFDVENAPKPDQPATDEAAGEKSAFGKLVYDNQLMVVTEKEPTEAQLKDLEMAMRVVKHTKSNGIVFVKDQQTVAAKLFQELGSAVNIKLCLTE